MNYSHKNCGIVWILDKWRQQLPNRQTTPKPPMSDQLTACYGHDSLIKSLVAVALWSLLEFY